MRKKLGGSCPERWRRILLTKQKKEETEFDLSCPKDLFEDFLAEFIPSLTQDLRKWFYCLAVTGITEASLRTLGAELEVTKDTVLKMIKRIKTAYSDNQELILNL